MLVLYNVESVNVPFPAKTVHKPLPPKVLGSFPFNVISPSHSDKSLATAVTL